MRRVIGQFKPGKAGGWEGEIRSLGLKERVRIVPNDDSRPSQRPGLPHSSRLVRRG